MTIADDNDEPLQPDLLPTDHAEAMRRFEAVRHRILHERAKGSQHQSHQKADMSQT